MHPHLNAAAAQADALSNVPLDLHFITFALLNALGMGAILMAVTALVDHKQLKGAAPQANVQNASNVLFMCVAIATVIILVGNNIARAFALGAAIALIRFKMKLGESSSGSGLLFAILCGMASAIGLHSVGWTLAIGYSLIQITLSLVIAKMEPKSETPVLAATSMDSSETTADPESPGHPASPLRPHLMPARFRDGKNKDRVTLMSLLALLVFGAAAPAEAVECAGSHKGTSIRMTADHAYGASAVAIYGGYLPYRAAECRFAGTPVLESAFKDSESYEIRCTKTGRKTASAGDRWQKSLVGVRLELKGGGFLAQDREAVEVLLTQSVMGTLALHAHFRMDGFDYGVITDLSPSADGKWSVQWAATGENGAEQTVACEIERIGQLQ